MVTARVNERQTELIPIGSTLSSGAASARGVDRGGDSQPYRRHRERDGGDAGRGPEVDEREQIAHDGRGREQNPAQDEDREEPERHRDERGDASSGPEP